MAIERNGYYEVGRCKPPRNTRFKKGQSGNPLGRPRGSRNPYTLLHKAFNEKVVISVNGDHRRITKLEAAFWQLANGAASGKLRHLLFVIQHMLPLLEQQAQRTTPSQPPKLTETDGREYASEVHRILREAGAVWDSDYVEDATAGPNSEPARELPRALPAPDDDS